MAGSDSRFNATKFRNGIKFAMEMAFPEDSNQQITWSWIPQRVFRKADSGGMPFDWSPTSLVSETDVSDFVVDCAVKFASATSTSRVGGTALGVFDPATAQVTMLDLDYDRLVAHGGGKFPDQAFIDGTRYEVQLIAPPVGLFEVTIYDIYLQAVDTSTLKS